MLYVVPTKKGGITFMQTIIKFELQPKQRPKLADAIATALRNLPSYQKFPTLSYKIGDCTLEKDGTLRIPDTVDRETITRLLEHLGEKGFTGKAEETEDRLVISMPTSTFTEVALANLEKLVDNKRDLLARAFMIDDLKLGINEENIEFAWFPYTFNPDEVSAYTEFVSRLCNMARTSKRVSSSHTEFDNDKYVFRCFLLRLGFIGDEYKTARKILLRNLAGNSAFRKY